MCLVAAVLQGLVDSNQLCLDTSYAFIYGPGGLLYRPGYQPKGVIQLVYRQITRSTASQHK